MRRTKKGTQKRSKLAKEAQEGTTRIERLDQNASTAGVKATGRSVGEVNEGFREIADEMNEYSMRSLENVFRAWQQFLDARPLRQAVELQTRYAQNAYEAYVGEMTRLGELYLNLTRRVSRPLGQMPRRLK